MENKTYIGGILSAVKSLTTGLKTSIKIFFEKDETEQYPENRKTLKFSDRNRFCLEMPHNERNEHKCVACGLCQMACPNDSIHVYSETVTTAEGKKKRQLVRYEYNLGQCMFCNLCVRACPHGAIRFNQEFEMAVFDKSKLILKLNHEGSKCEEKPAPVRSAAPKPAATTAAKPAPTTEPAAKAAETEKKTSDVNETKSESVKKTSESVQISSEVVKPASGTVEIPQAEASAKAEVKAAPTAANEAGTETDKTKEE